MTQPETLPYASPAAARKPRQQFLGLRFIMVLAICACVCGGVLYGVVSFHGGIRQSRDGAVVDLRALGFFQFDQNIGTLNNVPSKFRALDGQKVVLEGFMVYPDSATDPTQFQFVYNIQNCCFNGPPLVQERVFVNVPEGRRIEFTNNCARIIGTLHIRIEKDNDKIVKLYTMDVDKAEPL